MKLLGVSSKESEKEDIKIPNIKNRSSILKSMGDDQKTFRAFSPPPMKDPCRLQVGKVARLLRMEL